MTVQLTLAAPRRRKEDSALTMAISIRVIIAVYKNFILKAGFNLHTMLQFRPVRAI
jgi:hypothetical protein